MESAVPHRENKLAHERTLRTGPALFVLAMKAFLAG